jgi:hypothetical protein
MRMSLELDHVFICVEPGAPEAEELVRFGLREGSPNTHPGQGTACRRFPLLNAMIELIWVSDPLEAQSELTRPTLLWERWSGRRSGASPFGVCLRPAEKRKQPAVSGVMSTGAPFPGWTYNPGYLPEPLAFLIGEASLTEPMWVFMDFMRRSQRELHFVEHPNGIREITSLVLNTPAAFESAASRLVEADGVFSARLAPEPFLEIEFDSWQRNRSHDFRPRLPIVFHF